MIIVCLGGLPFYTTRLTYKSISLPAQDSIARATVLAYLEESLQPPDLEDTFTSQYTHLEDTPPLYSGIGALSGISVGSFPDNDIRLLILDLGKELGELAN